jgi:hypothetical protein
MANAPNKSLTEALVAKFGLQAVKAIGISQKIGLACVG